MKKLVGPVLCAGAIVLIGNHVGAAPPEAMRKGPLTPVVKPQQLSAPLAFKEPTWPLAFELAPGERTGAGFAVGAPGPIVVTVTWEGPPLTIKVGGPSGTPTEKELRSPATISATATDADVKAGGLFGVSIVAGEAPSKAAAAIKGAPLRAGPAKGTISVTHPAGGEQAASDAYSRIVAAKKPPVDPPPASVAPPAAIAQRIATVQNERLTRRTQMVSQLTPKLSTDVARRAGKSFAAVDPPTAQSQSAASAVGPAGGGGGVQTVSDPAIASLSVAEGEPGEPVLISGSAFSATQGEVHIIIANGKDELAPITAWNDTQVLAAVPSASGLPAFAGYVYLQRGTAKSKLVPFRFKPTIDVKTLGLSADRRFGVTPDSTYFLGLGTVQHWRPFIFGADGYDEFYLTTRLKNGWVVDSAYVVPHTPAWTEIRSSGAGNAYVTESRAGTDSPYVKVRWWLDGLSSILYRPVVVIKGPKGLPEL